MIIHLSDGTKCDYCGRYILTALGFDFGFNGKVFCCKECVDDYEKSRKGGNEMLAKDKLDTPICDFEEGAQNTQTPREFIRESEKEFGLIPKDLDSMTDKHLNEYLDFLDYLWEK